MPSLLNGTRTLFRSSVSLRLGVPAPLARLLNKRKGPDLEVLSKRILLPSLPVADEDVAQRAIWEEGRKLARQECWQELCDQIQLSDDARLATPGGASEATLLAMGAQSDVDAAARDAMQDGRNPDGAGIAALEEMLREHPDDYAPALVVVQAHLQIGRAWQNAANTDSQNAVKARAHFERARDLISEFDAKDLDAPSVAAAQCAVAEVLDPECTRIVTAYETLIALDQDSPQHLKAFGTILLPNRWGGSDCLETKAQDLLAGDTEVWGAGTYVWVYIDALSANIDVLEQLDTGRFIDGMRDILSRTDNQHFTNELAAFCALTMRPGAPLPSKRAEHARQKLHDCIDWILMDHLHELHPLIWARTGPEPARAAPPTTASRALIAQGRQSALHAVARRFARQMADGSSIVFSPAGMYRLPAM